MMQTIGKALLVVAGTVVLSCCTPAEPRRVAYDVGGDGQSASMTIRAGEGSDTQENDRALPWRHDAQLRPGDFYYVSAQNGRGGTQITCTVTMQTTTGTWRMLRTATALGEYAIATCSGTVPYSETGN